MSKIWLPPDTDYGRAISGYEPPNIKPQGNVVVDRSALLGNIRSVGITRESKEEKTNNTIATVDAFNSVHIDAFGQYTEFDGTNGQGVRFGFTPFSSASLERINIVCRVRSSGTGNRCYFDLHNDGGSHRLVAYTSTNNSQFLIFDGSAGSNVFDNSGQVMSALNDGQWHTLIVSIMVNQPYNYQYVLVDNTIFYSSNRPNTSTSYDFNQIRYGAFYDGTYTAAWDWGDGMVYTSTDYPQPTETSALSREFYSLLKPANDLAIGVGTDEAPSLAPTLSDIQATLIGDTVVTPQVTVAF